MNEAARHLFLTGLPGVGKSTIIRSLTAGAAGEATGFRTVIVPGGAGDFSLYLLPYGSGAPDPARLAETVRVAFRESATAMFRAFPDVFEREGVRILSRARAEGHAPIIMDELGFLEADARQFQETVLSILDEPVPVLGVVKPAGMNMDTPFLRAVREHGRVRLIEVTTENRDRVRAALLEERKR